MRTFLVLLCSGLCVISCYAQVGQEEGSIPCYDSRNRPQRCMPPFVNAAYGRVVEATNTCGVKSETEYCLQTGVTGARKYCYICNQNDRRLEHPSKFMTDFNNNYNWTWWQSETMLEGIQFPNVVNLTLHLKKAFDITYVNIRFYSPRPESFAIYKRTAENGPWIPFQFYSASCERTYNLPQRAIISAGNEAVAVCSHEFSDISPLTGGSVAFSTLEGRPSMFEFSRSPELQEWVTATDIKIVLTRMNTFGDEVFGDPQVLKSYFYAISDLAVGARCKCNGHARECRPVTGQSLEDRLQCVCEHHTMGVDCEKCLPFFNDAPWGRATEIDAHECKQCNCSGLSERCEFDEDLFRRTGHGGRCVDCRDNAAGANCELCLPNHYRNARDRRCTSCGCSEKGSLSLQCDDQGQCRCKPGVGGQRCDRCLPDFYDFSEAGCRPCECLKAGSMDNQPRCDTRTGECACKENVHGRQCNKCKPGFFGLSEDNPYGCIACFCYGHSSECTSTTGYYAYNISSDFNSGSQRWTAMTRSNKMIETQFNAITQNLGVKSDSPEPVYFVAPDRYLGDQRFSYNQFLTFDLRTGEDTARPSVVDIVLDGSGKSLSTHIFAQSNPVPGVTDQSFRFRLHENPTFQWSPRLKPHDFITVLSNLTAMKIRATYSQNGVGFIDNIHLETANAGFSQQDAATWVETCTCPKGFIGQFCESCAPGYKRDPPNGGPFARCVPCACNNHSDSCDVNTGRCICQHNTEGDFCDVCARGYYGDPTTGTPDDCKPCPCPGGGPCIQLSNDDVVCTECEEGYGGNLCDLCLDGFFGDPTGKLTGARSRCRRCLCSNNIDPNAVGNCNTTTGECLKCIRNTGGFNCENCLLNYYNNSQGMCEACNCYISGTVIQPGSVGCDAKTGQCLCLPNVVGRQCQKCEVGYWNLESGKGCEPCDCDKVGSTNYTCDERSGQCQCKQGVIGRRCDACDRYHFGFSLTGCQACNCDPVGSLDLQCDQYGYCPCRVNVDGRRCDRCMENKYDIASGCLDCPQCYDLVQRQVNSHRTKLRELTILINKTTNNPSLFNDTEFITHLKKVNDSVNVLLSDARGASTGDGTIGRQLQDLKDALNEVLERCGQITRNIASARRLTRESHNDILAAERAIDNADAALRMAENYIDKEGRAALKQALDALANFGQQSLQMTEYARRADLEAKRQKKEAEMIESLAKNALNTSREAYRLANESLSMPAKTRQEIEQLRREYDDATLLYQSTRNVANATYVRAKNARDEALSLYMSAKDQLPQLDVNNLKTEAQRIKETAEDIRKRAKQLKDDNKNLMARVANQTDEANDLLTEGDRLSQEVANLLAEADYARAEAKKAVEAAEKTLKEADETLRILQAFDELIANKDAAEDALKEVDAIRRTIQEARDTTDEARQALFGVDDDAMRVLQLAKQAEQKAKEASSEASRIHDTARETKDKAERLKMEATAMSDDVADAEDRMADMETQAAQDEQLAQDALADASEARLKAQEAYDKVDKAYQLVQNIRTELNDLGNIDMDQLRRLETQLNQVEQQLADADLDRMMQSLEKKNELIVQIAQEFETDLTQLRADVENINQIQLSLQPGCFKSVDIEKSANEP